MNNVHEATTILRTGNAFPERQRDLGSGVDLKELKAHRNGRLRRILKQAGTELSAHRPM